MIYQLFANVKDYFFKADVKVNSDLKHAKETLQAEEKKKKEMNKNISDVSLLLFFCDLCHYFAVYPASVIEQWQLFCLVIKMHLLSTYWLSCHF